MKKSGGTCMQYRQHRNFYTLFRTVRALFILKDVKMIRTTRSLVLPMRSMAVLFASRSFTRHEVPSPIPNMKKGVRPSSTEKDAIPDHYIVCIYPCYVLCHWVVVVAENDLCGRCTVL